MKIMKINNKMSQDKTYIDFDNYANNYNEILKKQLQNFGDVEYFSEYKVKIIKEFFDSQNIFPTNILEYGCGIGRNLKFLSSNFPKAIVYATDISKKSLEIAQKDNPHVVCFEIDTINKYLNYFDLVFIAGVYHHVPISQRDEVTKLIYNLSKFQGFVSVFEHNPYNPITQKLVRECEFDKDANLITKNQLEKIFIKHKFQILTSNYALFFPPKLRKFAFLEKFLKKLPLGGQYYIILRK